MDKNNFLNKKIIKKYKINNLSINQQEVFFNHMIELNKRLINKEQLNFELTNKMIKEVDESVVVLSKNLIKDVFHISKIDKKEIFLISFHLNLIYKKEN